MKKKILGAAVAIAALFAAAPVAFAQPDLFPRIDYSQRETDFEREMRTREIANQIERDRERAEQRERDRENGFGHENRLRVNDDVSISGRGGADGGEVNVRITFD